MKKAHRRFREASRFLAGARAERERLERDLRRHRRSADAKAAIRKEIEQVDQAVRGAERRFHRAWRAAAEETAKGLASGG